MTDLKEQRTGIKLCFTLGKTASEGARPLHHENAPAHVSVLVQQFMVSTNTTVIPHPLYSPDLVTCDFLLFPKMKLQLTRSRFYSIKEIQTVSQKVMKTLTPNDFQHCFRSLKSCLDRCVSAEGDYFEGDGGNRNFGKW